MRAKFDDNHDLPEGARFVRQPAEIPAKKAGGFSRRLLERVLGYPPARLEGNKILGPHLEWACPNAKRMMSIVGGLLQLKRRTDADRKKYASVQVIQRANSAEKQWMIYMWNQE